MRTIGAFVVFISLGSIEFWLGEGGFVPWASEVVMCGFSGCFAAILYSSGKLKKKILMGITTLILFSAVYFFGFQSFSRAFNECVERGEEVRVALKAYYAKTNQYPENLDQLGVILPCRRITRSTILDYERTKKGYILVFRDWLVEHVATESDAFFAKK